MLIRINSISGPQAQKKVDEDIVSIKSDRDTEDSVTEFQVTKEYTSSNSIACSKKFNTNKSLQKDLLKKISPSVGSKERNVREKVCNQQQKAKQASAHEKLGRNINSEVEKVVLKWYSETSKKISELLGNTGNGKYSKKQGDALCQKLENIYKFLATPPSYCEYKVKGSGCDIVIAEKDVIESRNKTIKELKDELIEEFLNSADCILNDRKSKIQAEVKAFLAFEALQKNDNKLLQHLLVNGLNPNARGRDIEANNGFTYEKPSLLMTAVARGNLEAVQLLLNTKGIKVNSKEKEVQQGMGKHARTETWKTSPLIEARSYEKYDSRFSKERKKTNKDIVKALNAKSMQQKFKFSSIFSCFALPRKKQGPSVRNK